MKMFEGDQYFIRIVLTIGEGEDERSLVPDDVQDLEIMLGDKSKTYLEGGVGYDPENGEWLYYITQEESFCFPALMKARARPKIAGNVYGVDLGTISVSDMETRRVL